MRMDCANLTLLLIMKHLKFFYSRESKPSAWIERWVLRLQPYNYQVCYMSSTKDIADTLSKLTKIVASNQSQDDDEYLRMVELHAPPAALKIKEIERVSAEDPELQCLVKERFNGTPKQYLPVCNELTFIGHVFLRGTRIVILKLYERELSAWHTRGTKELSRQRRDSGRMSGGRGWIGMRKSCVRSVRGANL